MFYIKQSAYGSLLYLENKIQPAEKASISIIKSLCQQNLFSYESRIAYTNKLFHIHTKTPIYINDFYLFIPTKSPRNFDNIWINYFKIKRIHKYLNHTIVVFQNQTELEIDISFQAFTLKMKQCDMILSYIKQIELNII